jgi:Zn-dependent protease with chaperone function
MSWVYLAGVVLMLVRLGVSLIGAQRICRSTVPVDSPEILQLFDNLVRELGLRAAPALVWSRHTVAPAVIGIIRPTILLPFSLATALSPDELASILAHELAHIRRHDLWVNLFQRFAEARLFFHPAVWLAAASVPSGSIAVMTSPPRVWARSHAELLSGSRMSVPRALAEHRSLWRPPGIGRRNYAGAWLDCSDSKRN